MQDTCDPTAPPRSRNTRDVAMIWLARCKGAIYGKALDDATNGGLAFYFGIDGPNNAGMNNYAVRVHNGEELKPQFGGTPTVQGLTIISNQAMFVQGHYNSQNKKPAAFLGDSINILSAAWNNDAD